MSSHRNTFRVTGRLFSHFHIRRKNLGIVRFCLDNEVPEIQENAPESRAMFDTCWHIMLNFSRRLCDTRQCEYRAIISRLTCQYHKIYSSKLVVNTSWTYRGLIVTSVRHAWVNIIGNPSNAIIIYNRKLSHGTPAIGVRCVRPSQERCTTIVWQLFNDLATSYSSRTIFSSCYSHQILRYARDCHKTIIRRACDIKHAEKSCTTVPSF